MEERVRRHAIAAVLVAALGGPAGAEIRFTEVADDWGIDFEHDHGGKGDYFMIETMGAGVVLFDYDGDGDDDVFLVDSGELTGPGKGVNGSRLLRNEGPGVRFLDVTVRAGVTSTAYGMGGTTGDIDGDGDLDLYLTAFGRNELWLNSGAGTFSEAATHAGIADATWSMSAAFADADLDGDLDLYVTNYVDFAYDDNPLCGLESRNLRSYCHPDVYDGLADTFFRNRGDGTFVDATTEAGFAAAGGKGLGVLFEDLDGDGLVDVYVANDMTANNLFRNAGDGTFADTAILAGVAFSGRGEAEASMGVDAGDLDGDQRLEIMLTHLDQQTNALYSLAGPSFYADQRFLKRLAEPSFHRVGFGLVFGDFDQDRHLDVAVANGHIVHNIDEWDRGTTFKQANQVFRNVDGTFEEVSASGLTGVRASRGMAAGDLDGDGDLDLVVSNSSDRAEVYRNDHAGGGWLEVDFVTGGGLAPRGLGASVLVADAGASQRRSVRTASSYLSQNSLSVHFGIGASKALEVTVDWPGGGRRRVSGVPPSKRVRIVR